MYEIEDFLTEIMAIDKLVKKTSDHTFLIHYPEI